MKKLRVVTSILVTLVLALGLALPVSAQVEPSEVTADLEAGGSIEVTKEVATPEIPPLIDILLLEDETGSFMDDIDELQTLAPAIWDAIAASGADFTMGVSGFRDFAQPDPDHYPPDPPWGWPGDWVYRLLQDLTGTKATFVAGVNALTATSGAGADTPEAQLEALHYLATPSHAAIDSNGDGDTTDSNDTPAGQQPTWRTGAVRVVLLATDATCHVNGDSTKDGDGNTVYWPGDSGTTSAGVTADILNSEGIVVIGLTPWGTGITCVDTLATVTGGSVHATTATGEDIKEAILAGLEELTTDVWWEVEAAEGLTVELAPVVYSDIEGETTVTFTETITVDEGIEACTTLTATVTFYANNYDAGEGGVVGTQTISIHVVPTPVEIDIKPGSFPNSINPGGKGVIPVAILTTDDFDASTVDGETALFGPGDAEPVHYALEDVDGDGDIDMILHFKTEDTGIAAGDTEATLTAQTFGGTSIIGTDSVRTVPPKGKKK